MMPLAEKKKQARQQVLQKIHQLSAGQRQQSEEKIYRHLFGLSEFIKADTILAYVGCQHEIHTHILLEHCLKMSKTLLLPRVNVKNNTMSIHHIQDPQQDLIPGYGNINEPDKNIPVYPEDQKIDLIIVPAVAFSVSGQRLGRGKGFYDRFLAQYPDSFTLGLAYQEQLISNLPTESHDLPIDILITDKEIIRFFAQKAD